MKAKHARMMIGKKFDDWVSSIQDERVKTLVKENTLISGGCIVSALTGTDVNDFDVFFRNKETTEAVAEYYVARFKNNPPTRFKDQPGRLVDIRVDSSGERVKIVVKSAGVASEDGSNSYKYFEQYATDEPGDQFLDEVTKDAQDTVAEGEKYRPVFMSANAITLSHKIQVVVRFYGEAEEVHSSFDFVHCTCWWDSKDRKLMLPPAALEAMLAKELIYTGGSKYPICAMIRTRKFLGRGWHITAGQYLKIAWDISQLDLTNIETLEDQLVGVDSAYFLQVIAALRDKGQEKIEVAYHFELIDRIF